jgi:hypothetical protein
MGEVKAQGATDMSNVRLVDGHPQYPHAVKLDQDSVIYSMACVAAKCGGIAYLDMISAEIFMCDGGDLVLWSGRIGIAQ